MTLSDFNFDLPEKLIGQKAIEPRDSCRLLLLNRQTEKISHHVFSDLEKMLDKNSVLVLNNTKVFPARLYGTKESGGKTEILLLKQTSTNSFSAIGKGKLKVGTLIYFSLDFLGKITLTGEEGIEIEFNISGVELINEIDKNGKTPLPPYIHSKTKESEVRNQYQTVYAKVNGSAAAPTAGLHFTENLLNRLEKRGVETEKITLHVGLGTFKPVSEKQVINKTLHSEEYVLTDATAEALNKVKSEGRKIIAVGTTSCRLLETLSDEKGIIHPGRGETNIFIQPGYRFKFVDGLITNFHLPSTSLLMLVCAFAHYPNTNTRFSNFNNSPVGKAYKEAINKKYKFFSFGDAMMVV